VDTGCEWRGGQTQMLHLLRSRLNDGVALPRGASLEHTIKQLGNATLYLNYRGSLSAVRSVRRAVAEFEPDLLAAHTSHAHNACVAARCAQPLVVHRRVDFPPGRCSYWKYRRADRFVAVSGAVKNILVQIGVDANKIDVVYDGVDGRSWESQEGDPLKLRKQLGFPDEVPLVLAVGALVPHKGHQYLIEAMTHLPGHYLVIAGDGPERNRLRRQIQRLGLQKRARLLGQRADIPFLMKSVGTFCHCSVEEGMGQVVVEAMLARVPVVATAAGGVPEIVGASALVVPVADSVTLADALAKSTVEYDLLEADAQRAQRLFSVAKMVAGTERAYEEVLCS
jgi:glycosyltransferase involved in cell wall biosynthesis